MFKWTFQLLINSASKGEIKILETTYKKAYKAAKKLVKEIYELTDSDTISLNLLEIEQKE